MSKVFILILNLLFTATLMGADNFPQKREPQNIDLIHQRVSEWIYETSNKIDIFFSGNSEEVYVKNGTYLDTSFDTYAETYRSQQYRFNISLRLRLPRTQRKLNLVLEDFKETSSTDLSKSASMSDTIGSNDYLLGVHYRQQESRFTRIGYGGGVRFRKVTPDPYLSAYISRSFYFAKKWELLLREKVRYFADYRLDNTIEASLIKVISEELRFSFTNIYRFLEYYSYRNEIIDSLSLKQFLNSKMGVSYSASAYSSGDTQGVFKLQYYYGGISFRHYYYRNWAYYQTDAGVMLREANNFKPSTRVLFKLGFIFGKRK